MSRLLEEFNIIKEKKIISNDYNMFEDKELLESIRLRILEDLNDKGINGNVTSDTINSEIDEVTNGYYLNNNERIYLYNLIDNEVNNSTPLDELLNDSNVTEIMVNSPSSIYIETEGRIIKDESMSFVNDEHIIRTINKLLSKVGKSIDINNPIIDARLVDGSRINAVIPPLSKSPVITIRKFKKNIVTMDDLIGSGTLTTDMARFLEIAVKAKLNILICGPSGAGKTTILNILGNYINDNERIVTIEDVLELNLNKDNLVALESNKVNNITLSDLLNNSLRMRPDRLIIGEIRGNEAFYLLQAMNSGQDGTITTIHSNSTKDALSRLETMILMNKDISIKALREYIGDAIDIIVFITRMKDGRRKIIDISEVLDDNDLDNPIKNIFKFKLDPTTENGSVTGEFKKTTEKVEVLTKIKRRGFNDLDELFKVKKKKN